MNYDIGSYWLYLWWSW